MLQLGYFSPKPLVTDFTKQNPQKSYSLHIPEHPTHSVVRMDWKLLPTLGMIDIIVEIPRTTNIVHQMIQLTDLENEEFMRGFVNLLTREVLTAAQMPENAIPQMIRHLYPDGPPIAPSLPLAAPIVAMGALTDEQTRKLDNQSDQS